MPTYTLDGRRRASPPFQCTTVKKLIFFFLKIVIMVVVFSIFLFFLGFAAIVLLHFLFMSSTFQRRFIRFSLPNRTGTAAQSSASPVSATFPLALVRSQLPNVAYSAAGFSKTTDCAICLDSFKEGDVCRNLLACDHLFHSKCVDKWIGRNPNCPICRTRVDLFHELQGPAVSGDDRWKRLWDVGIDQGNSH